LKPGRKEIKALLKNKFGKLSAALLEQAWN